MTPLQYDVSIGVLALMLLMFVVGARRAAKAGKKNALPFWLIGVGLVAVVVFFHLIYPPPVLRKSQTFTIDSAKK